MTGRVRLASALIDVANELIMLDEAASELLALWLGVVCLDRMALAADVTWLRTIAPDGFISIKLCTCWNEF